MKKILSDPKQKAFLRSQGSLFHYFIEEIKLEEEASE